MKIRIKLDPNSQLGSYQRKGNPIEGAFVDFDLGIFNTIYQMFPSNLINYYTAIDKASEKSIIPTNQPGKNLVDNTEIIAVNGHDIYNYVARFGSANFQIQNIMKLTGKLDHDILLKAIRLSIEAEPIFGCRLVENDPPYFKRLDNIDNIEFCTYEKTNRPNEAIKRFLESPLDMDRDPMIKMKLISSVSYDTLCMKINHTCCDGTGTKEYIQLLSDIYSQLVDNKDIHIPKPKIRSRKDQDRLFEALGIKEPDSAWTGELDVPKNLWTFPWRQGKQGKTHSSVCQLPNGYLNIMSRYAKARNATINDMILTAFYRAMFNMSQPRNGIPMNISMTVDLRRYLPDQRTEAIRNFSGGIDTKLAKVDNESFEKTLARVAPIMNEIKNGKPGLQSAVGLERVENARFSDTLVYYKTAAENNVYSDKCAPVLSNLGFLNKTLFTFGKVAVTDAYIVPPAACAPGVLLCVGSYNGILTMAASYYESQVREEDMNRLLSSIKNELLECCKL